jgi:putative nucleotidyltransferase with HDIG domain
MVGLLGMFASLKKNQLVKKGFACNKTRRRVPKNEFLRSLESSRLTKILIFMGFLAGLAGLIFYGPQSGQAKQFLFALLVFFTALAQLWINHPQTFAKNSRVVLLFGTILAHLLVMKAMMLSIESHPARWSTGKLLFPYALAPLIISALLGKNQGVYTTIYASLWGSLLWNLVDPFFLAMSLISGFVAVFVTLQVRRRGQFIRAGFFVGVATWLLALSFGLIEIYWLDLGATNWRLVGLQSLTAVGSGLITAMLVSGSLPVLEQTFNITTAMSWLELTDLNHPLLMRLSLEAPGTYEHSQAVARLAEAAAEKIGANASMCRTCAYFHDIGKLVKPEYFTENMRSSRNPHDDLAPTMSALILIAHVKEGVDLALKHKLNPCIVDVIQQHHGDSLVYYFYKRALQQQEDARAGGKILNLREEDIPEVREENFRYSGPRPQTKESAIISLADAVESASRSLEKPTPQRIEELVSDIVDARVADHQLSDCDLTFHELGEVMESFGFTLKSMLHRRIAYPPKKDKELNSPSASSAGSIPMREREKAARSRETPAAVAPIAAVTAAPARAAS